MRVKIIKCQDASKWYAGLIGEVFEVDKDYYLDGSPDGIERFKILTGLSWTNAFIRKSDCEVVGKDGYSFKPIHECVEDGIKALVEYNNLPSEIVINGKRYRLVSEISEAPTVESKEPELNTFQDCWEKVQPEVTLDPKGIKHMNLPSIQSAKQIQAAIKLFVIQHALNCGLFYPAFQDYACYVGLRRVNDTYTLVVDRVSNDHESDILGRVYTMQNPYAFRSIQLAHKAIEIAEDIWMEYFGI